ncbi:MAG: JDVT-CTERM domain-containing protein [Gammaproteobacteria bacterium]|jgi:hypothetical protein
MKYSRLPGAACAVLLWLAGTPAGAALTGVLPATPGGTDYQAYYDDVADLTWLADANAAGTTMNWHAATAWAAGLNINGVTGWRLPYTQSVDGTTADDALFSYLGDEDRGFNISAPGTQYAGSQASEMAYLYHNTLGNKSYCDPAQSTVSNCVVQPGWGLVNPGPFRNIQGYYYWSATQYGLDPSKAWGFHFTIGGRQGTDNTTGGYRWVWAVHSGNAGALSQDSNGDGISDADAIALGLDPYDADADTDNDGISDVIEVGGNVNAPLDSDGDGVIDALEPGMDASDAMVASGLKIANGTTVSITTAAGESLSMVSVNAAAGGPGGIDFSYGSISYRTTAVANASIPVTLRFSIDLPANPVIYKVDYAGGYTQLPDTTWRQIDARTVEITLTDGDPSTDLDGALDNSIDDPIAIGGAAPAGGGGGGGCTMHPGAAVDPVWSLLLIMAGAGYLRALRQECRLDFNA